MELSMEYQSNNVCTVAFSGTGRQPISSDSTLPDYCGDIERILHCGACIQLHTVNAAADRLRAEGEIELRILYLTSDALSLPEVTQSKVPQDDRYSDYNRSSQSQRFDPSRTP